MKSKHYNILLLGLIIIIGVSCNEERVDFNAQIRPILNKNCVSCHGGVRQNGGYDLIFEENALGKTKNDNIGIVPGNPGKSELIKRINHKDPEMRMPPESEPLKKEEIKLLTNWIKQGAQWDDHWAYINPKEIVVPKTESSWVNNEIDHFILQKIDAQGLKPSAEADKFDLVRRLYLDLTGLPPSLNQVKSFVNDTKSNAYENLVDTLLVSENYGEHWASMWLDLARYADSKGYEKDDGRQIWKYRDKPFDEFTIEQLAGDLLTDPSFDQLIATAFHRNTLNNDEGGTNNEEYRVAAVIDRVNTTFEVFQSTTMACVQCHSHPYEPIKHEEYYKSFAFFNNTSDWDISPEIPLLKELVSEDSVKLEEVKEWISKHSDAKEGNKWEQFVLVGEPKLRAEDFDSVQNVVHRNRTGQDYMVASNGSLIKIKNVDLNNINRIYFNIFIDIQKTN